MSGHATNGAGAALGLEAPDFYCHVYMLSGLSPPSTRVYIVASGLRLFPAEVGHCAEVVNLGQKLAKPPSQGYTKSRTEFRGLKDRHQNTGEALQMEQGMG